MTQGMVAAGGPAIPGATATRDWSWVLAVVGTTATVLAVASMVAAGRPVQMIYGHWMLHNAPTAVICLWLGHLVVRQRPGHLGGVLLSMLGAVSAVHVCIITLADARMGAAGLGYEGRRFEAFSPASLPLDASIPMWVSTWTWIPIIVISTTVMLLTFPDGRLPGPRWRVVVVLAVVALALLIAAYMVEFWPGTDRVIVMGDTVGENPVSGWLMAAGAATLVVATAASVASLVLRWRQAGADERVQIRPVAVMWVALALVNVLLFPFQWLWIPLSLGIIWLLLGAYAFAITRYRLHDLEVVVNRATVAALLALLLTAGYLAVVVGAGHLVGRGRDDTAVPLVAAGLVALAFGPVRHWVQRLVDRLLYGRDRDAQQVFSELASRLRDASPPEELLDDVAHLLVRGTGAQRIEVVTQVHGRIHLLAAHDARAPTDTTTPGTPDHESADATAPEHTAPDHETPANETPDREQALWSIAVSYEGHDLGHIRVFARAATDLAPGALALVRDVAATLGVVLHNAQLTEQLHDQVEELRRSRSRLVAAQDDARRSLERDIHDGAQARLVALRMHLGLAERLAGSHDDPALRTLLADLADQVDEAVGSLRTLGRGLQPPVLDGAGVGAALRSEARTLPVSVTVTDEGVGRHDPVVEAAVYFSCLEAIQNAVRHGQARTVTVELSNGTGVLAFEVRDDGVGFDPEVVCRGAGLTNLEDRVTSLGGDVVVDSSPGRGTRVSGQVPQSLVSER